PRDGRVHTTFNPVGAATGRLSSSNPNLQNIPIRAPQGRAIRRGFVAAPGAVLVGADYSQIELRLMAHLSGDPNLIEAFVSGEDVATNAPIQGSAADLMKLAMIRVHRALKRVAPSARLLLQVHDELLIEAPAEAADAVAERVRAEMEHCFPLRVPLQVSVGSGATWFDVH